MLVLKFAVILIVGTSKILALAFIEFLLGLAVIASLLAMTLVGLQFSLCHFVLIYLRIFVKK